MKYKLAWEKERFHCTFVHCIENDWNCISNVIRYYNAWHFRIRKLHNSNFNEQRLLQRNFILRTKCFLSCYVLLASNWLEMEIPVSKSTVQKWFSTCEATNGRYLLSDGGGLCFDLSLAHFNTWPEFKCFSNCKRVRGSIHLNLNF